MTPFLQFRMWLRRSPRSERLLAAGAGAVVLVLLGLALVPGSGPSGSNVAAGGAAGQQGAGSVSAAGAAGPAGTTQTGAAPGSSGGPTAPGAGSPAGPGSGLPPGAPAGAAGSGPASAQGGDAAAGATAGAAGGSSSVSAAAARCGSSGATDQGVTARQISIDVDVADLAGQAGNSLAGIPTPDQEEAMFGAAIDAVNAAGGVACRRVVAKYYTADALDPSSLEAVCLNIVADHPFALLDDGLGSPDGPPGPRDCPPSNQVPEFGVLALGQSEIARFSPYLIGDNSSAEEIVNDWVLGAHQLGWFSGSGKVGLLEQDCVPDINGIVMSDLARVGVASSQVETFDFGCPDEIPPPNQVEEAVLEFKTAGVTKVMDDGGVYESYFSKDAAQQGYKPRYSVGDQASIALWDNPDFGPDPSNFSGALAVTAMRYGAENTPGTAFNAATAACDRAMAAKGLPPAEHSPDGFSGVACTLVNLFATAASDAPALRRNELAAGLYRAGHLDLPFPAGPADFTVSKGLHAGGYWRADTWVTSCACFRVSTPAFSPSFQPVP